MTTPWFIVCFIAVNVAFTGFISNHTREIQSEKVCIDSNDGSKWLRGIHASTRLMCSKPKSRPLILLVE
jgi:hypothetical protein